MTMNVAEALARANSWAVSPEIRPAPGAARAVATVLAEHIRDLQKVATGELPHIYNGLCPDEVEGFAVRDDECPACRVLLAAKI